MGNDLEYLINFLLKEKKLSIKIPDDENERFDLFRGLVNIRPPKKIAPEFLKIQDEFLKSKISEKGITKLSDLKPIEDGIYLWKGDITTLECGAVVNAANSGMTGCYVPCHACIDNCIHTFAGIRLRLECAEIMRNQKHEEPVGDAKITRAYNLPCDYVIHTVGPIVEGEVAENDEKLLASCYRSCLRIARENGVKSVAFCCVSTGVFHFPNQRAAEIAVDTVRKFRGNIEVIFNVFKEVDHEIYGKLLG